VVAPGAGASNRVAVAPDAFQIRLEDPGIKPQASESAFHWERVFPRERPQASAVPTVVIWQGAVCDADGLAGTPLLGATAPVTWAFPREGDWVELDLLDGTRLMVGHHEDGLFSSSSPMSAVKSAAVTGVYRVGPHRENVRWRLASGGGVPFSRGVEQKVELSTRLRMSVWSFNAAFIKVATPKRGTVPAKVVLDEKLIKLLEAARIDDVSLVGTVTFDERTGGVTWANSYQPGANSEFREPYLRALVESLRAIKVQVLAGYAFVKSSKKWADMTEAEKKIAARFRHFAHWLEKASDFDIANHAEAIDSFCATWGLDGIGFDFEFDELREVHREKLAVLYRRCAELLAQRNGIVSYANMPFLKKDGGEGHEFMKVQPFSLARRARNLIARPMCFDDSKSTELSDVIKSIACALGEANGDGGAGLHPSQVQFGIWADKIKGGMEALCRDVLRPNRIGVILYQLPFPRDSADVFAAQKAFFEKCIKWDLALNPDEAAPGQEGQPLQVPR
jgi:hypothetical protein